LRNLRWLDCGAKPVSTFAYRARAMSEPRDPRHYPERPYLAVSAVIIRDGEFLIVRRARPPMQGLFTLPGGGVETGESLFDAVRREVHEETGLAIEPVGIAGTREVIGRDDAGDVQRHFVILAFAARWVAGEPRLNDELAEARWIRPSGLKDLTTTEGLAEIVAAAFELMERQS
jgi:ADP-ribose pyrophosphatase YjhB (NUDIX family)